MSQTLPNEQSRGEQPLDAAPNQTLRSVPRIEFGTDGWRAVIAEDFTFENVRICAQAVAEYLKAEGLGERGLVVGFDTRFGSERFADAVAEVAAASGVPVYLCSSPAPTPV